MPKFEFDWTPRALQKLEDNGVTREDFEQVVLKARRIEYSRSSGHPACRGRLGSRVLFCVFENIDGWRVRPITAFCIHED
jgi:hypothetical protein